jgi:manganese-dependent ADP-ribose/CDP-alcohol diphosphatase
LFWNYEEILAVLHRHPSVQMVLCGHNHVGFYQTDDGGIHHLAVQAVLETAPHDDAFAVMEVFDDHIFCRGAGRVPNIKFYLRWTGDARQERLRKSKSSTRASAEKRRRTTRP